MASMMDEIGDACYAMATEAVWGDAQSQAMADSKREKQHENDDKNKSLVKTVGSNMIAGVMKSGQSFVQEKMRGDGQALRKARKLPQIKLPDKDDGFDREY